MPEDDEELALSLNGKKKRIKKADFETAMRDSGLEEKAINNIFNKFVKSLPKWNDLIQDSFLPKDLQSSYHNYIHDMASRLGLA